MLCKYGCGQEAKYQLKNGDWICSPSKNSCPVLRKKNSQSGRNYKKEDCKYCKKKYIYLKLHEPKCYLNPINKKLCPVCNKPIKDYKNAKTCSSNCANKLFKRCGKDHWNYQNGGKDNYRYICFKYHKKKCIICGEYIAVDVHHYDKNNKNNHPTNFIPLCHTHHLYLRYKEEKYIIKECIDDYHKNFLKEWKNK